ncbi:hypothetical protein LINGRAHAP2_LOCUS13522, partial [Linum grandiflorum]
VISETLILKSKIIYLLQKGSYYYRCGFGADTTRTVPSPSPRFAVRGSTHDRQISMLRGLERDFEVGDWVEEEDREELEEIRKKINESKAHLRKGIAITANDGLQMRGLDDDKIGSDDSGYYVTTDEDDEAVDHGVRIPNPLPKYNPRTDIPYFCKGMRFTDILEVRSALQKHAIKEKRDIRFKKSEPTKIRAFCKGKRCPWTFYVSHNKRFKVLQLITYKEHTCSEHYKNKFVSPKYIANHYKRIIRSTPRWKIRDMRETSREDFGVDVSLMQCSRAKARVTQTTLSSYTEEYALLRTYAEELLRVNPGSSVTVMVDRDNPNKDPMFKRMYVCFDTLKRGFLAGCRKIIAMDGCFLKGLCKGELLTAIARDANNQIYPVAWCVVEVESKSSWDWFLEQLGVDLNIGIGQGWSFSTDQQKGLVPSIAELFREAEHRLCARHIYQNWRKKFAENKWQKMFWECAKSDTKVLFNHNLAKIKKSNPDAAESMIRIDPKYWCRAWFSNNVKCDSVDNNLLESFNALILEARHKPIYIMLEDIRIMCMETIATKREKAIE